jgi:hypothetical protein
MAHFHNFSSLPDNVVQNVETYQLTQIAWLLLEYALIRNSNRHFDDLIEFGGQLGSTVSFNREPQNIFTRGTIKPTMQPITQKKLELKVDQQGNSSFSIPPIQDYFNIEPTDWMNKVQTSALKEIGTSIETDLGNQITNCFRYYGDGVTAITSAEQLADCVELFEEFGASNINMLAVLPSVVYPKIMSTMLQQFATKRNDELADYKWYQGEYNGCSWGKSKVLPIHKAGTIGISNLELTVVSTNDPSGANVTQITCSGSIGTDANAIKKGDCMRFIDGVSINGVVKNMRYLTYHGHVETQNNYVAMCAAADAGSNSGLVTINLTHPLCSVSGIAENNINYAIQPGMKIHVNPSHRVGVIMSGNPLYLAMPNPMSWIKTDPFKQTVVVDEETGISVCMYEGWSPDQAVRFTSMPSIWGTTIEPLNAMRICLPL